MYSSMGCPPSARQKYLSDPLMSVVYQVCIKSSATRSCMTCFDRWLTGPIEWRFIVATELIMNLRFAIVLSSMSKQPFQRRMMSRLETTELLLF